MIVLAVMIALEDTGIGADEAIASIVGAAVATVLAELYADYLAATIREGRRPTPEERANAVRNALAGLVAAVLPVVFFVLAEAGALELDTAFDAAIWTGVGVVGAYAFVANRVGGMSIWWSLAAGGAFTVLGTVLVVIKALVSH